MKYIEIDNNKFVTAYSENEMSTSQRHLKVREKEYLDYLIITQGDDVYSYVGSNRRETLKRLNDIKTDFEYYHSLKTPSNYESFGNVSITQNNEFIINLSNKFISTFIEKNCYIVLFKNDKFYPFTIKDKEGLI
jgi:hypothetical protein